MEQLVGPLKAVLLARPKQDWVKQELDKMEELKRCAIVVIVDFRNLADIEKNRYYLDLLHTIDSERSLKATYDQVLSTVERSARVSRESISSGVPFS
ncbi:unnamed protein product [Dibothriocephalus latus]|uniref:TATA-binding protein interacting (TIP20) domain-containing protein n=1 Tax=Dibothriocephalus latus TaxID=60516 RepID=A0A3P7MAL3_DIBLA|nr:unnamed protein product [Dibothriocephalus latus]